MAGDLGNVWVRGGMVAGSETMSVRAFDGMDWSAWDTFNLTTLPINHAPIVTAPGFTASHNQNIAASSLFSVSDADNDTITNYQFWDSTTDPTSGHWLVGGVAQGANQAIDVTAAQLSQTTFQSASGSDDLWVRAFDGINWSAWNLVSAPIDAKPVVAGGNASLALNEVVAASSLFSVTDADNDTMTEYQFWDSTAAPASAYFSVNGTTQSANHAIDVMASHLAQVNVVGGSAAGTDQLWVRTNDGTVWSDWHSFMA